MPKLLVTYVRFVDSMNNWLGKILCGGTLVLVGLCVIESVSRYFFKSPTIWTVELSQFTMGAYLLMAGGYALLHKRHVKMDALYSRWSPKTKAIADLATFSILAVYLIVFMVGGIENALSSLRLGVHTASMWSPPVAPIKFITVAAAGVVFLQAVAFVIRDLSIVFRGKDLA